MHYSAPEFLLIIAAMGTIIVNIINAWKNTSKIQDNTNKLDIIGQKTATIEGHVNSKETKYVEQIASLTRENEILRTVIIDKDKTAALLAQSVITSKGTKDDRKV